MRVGAQSRSSRTRPLVLVLAFLIIVTIFYRRREATSQSENSPAAVLVHGPPLHESHSNQDFSSTERSHDVETTGDTDIPQNAEHTTQHPSTPSIANDPTTLENTDDPCRGRPQPVTIPVDPLKPPSVYFLHIPKTAGTLMHHLVIRYANKTKGLACQYLYDGNRFGPGDYHLSVKPPPEFPEGSIERDTIDAITARNVSRKLELLEQGACRAMRGHVTYKQRDYMGQPIVSLAVVRDPLERFISMYEFAMMMVKSRPGATGWDQLLSGDIEADLKNSSSLLHRGFYGMNDTWIAHRNVGFSFHFYGVLHQLSGANPVFEGEGVPEEFRIVNADELAEKAKDNICSTHILGTQSDMDASLDLFFKTITPFSNWTELEIKQAKMTTVNKNAQKKKTAGEGWSESMRTIMQKRFQHETDVHAFAMRVIEYRKQLAQSSQR